jgi:nicotinamide mononucleotide transporter
MEVFLSLWQQFFKGLMATTAIEFIAVIAGIISVVFSRRESILVYPTGLLNTILYIYLGIKGQLFGEASVNLYYTIMSIYGWWNWSRKDTRQHHIVHITPSTRGEIVQQWLFFAVVAAILWTLLYFIRKGFAPEAIPWADAIASASAFTGMWLMTRKKIESWWWWILTNILSIPLWFVKGYVFTSVQFMVLLVLAISGLVAWKRRYRQAQQSVSLSDLAT